MNNENDILREIKTEQAVLGCIRFTYDDWPEKLLHLACLKASTVLLTGGCSAEAIFEAEQVLQLHVDDPSRNLVTRSTHSAAFRD